MTRTRSKRKNLKTLRAGIVRKISRRRTNRTKPRTLRRRSGRHSRTLRRRNSKRVKYYKRTKKLRGGAAVTLSPPSFHETTSAPSGRSSEKNDRYGKVKKFEESGEALVQKEGYTHLREPYPVGLLSLDVIIKDGSKENSIIVNDENLKKECQGIIKLFSKLKKKGLYFIFKQVENYYGYATSTETYEISKIEGKTLQGVYDQLMSHFVYNQKSFPNPENIFREDMGPNFILGILLNRGTHTKEAVESILRQSSFIKASEIPSCFPENVEFIEENPLPDRKKGDLYFKYQGEKIYKYISIDMGIPEETKHSIKLKYMDKYSIKKPTVKATLKLCKPEVFCDRFGNTHKVEFDVGTNEVILREMRIM